MQYALTHLWELIWFMIVVFMFCLLYTSDAADE